MRFGRKTRDDDVVSAVAVVADSGNDTEAPVDDEFSELPEGAADPGANGSAGDPAGDATAAEDDTASDAADVTDADGEPAPEAAEDA